MNLLQSYGPLVPNWHLHCNWLITASSHLFSGVVHGTSASSQGFLCGDRLAAQAALVELLEEAGLPPVCAALAVEEDADKQLGTVLAEAVQVCTLGYPGQILEAGKNLEDSLTKYVSSKACKWKMVLSLMTGTAI